MEKQKAQKAESKKAAEMRQAKAAEALEMVQQGVQAVWSSEEWTRWLSSLSKFHRYSLNNQLLIFVQRPDAELVASFTDWKRKHDRYVRKGEKGIEIFAPVTRKVVEEDEGAGEEREVRRVVGYKVVYVFDVSQTGGEPLPEVARELCGEVEGYSELIAALESASAYPVTYSPVMPSGCNGFFARGEKIAIKSGMSQQQTVKTLAHELAHSRLHDLDPDDARMPDRSMREVQAESVACAVCAAFGIDSSSYSFGYVAGWAEGKSDDELRACLEDVSSAVRSIVADVSEKLGE